MQKFTSLGMLNNGAYACSSRSTRILKNVRFLNSF